ncbi:hypothetical protein [Diaphorobacter nitroreducens]|uniref:hypothetical protein n=1 Tax=Diaphorobacter nitroreducens TaxID=164759 RepID=UPI00289CBA76|nr:hypothetical protein [Diaphorobacter nitroreducens]
MNRFSVWSPVQVTNEDHPRFGQAGIVHAVNPAVPDEVAVRFDVDSQVVAVAVADLKGL